MAAPTLHCGFGKLVLSGDTIVIRDRAHDGPPSSRTLVLSNITCPKVAKKPSPSAEPSKDEPFGWMAREYVRTRVVGKEVCYTVDNEFAPGRIYGCVFLGKDAGAQNLVHLLVSEGLARVRRNMSRVAIEKSATLQTLIGLEEKAKSEHKGVWSKSTAGSPRNICWSIPDLHVFFENHGRKPLHGVVEFVRDASTMHVLLMPIDGDGVPTYYSVIVLLSGIKTPGSKLVEDSRVPDPFFLDAQFFVETRLLQRDVTVILEGVNSNHFVGSVLHPNGNIAVFLLREGLAQCLEWNLAVVSQQAGGADVYRAAEQMAKQKRLRIWENYIPADEAADNAEITPCMKMEYMGTVVEVGNGDSAQVRCEDGVVRKFFLSSVRPPRGSQEMEKSNQTGSHPLYQVPFLYEAREFLRKRLVGKHVNVYIDYIQPRPVGSSLDERVYATILVGDSNIAEALLYRGLGSALRYRNITDSRSRAYDALLAAEASAQRKGVGIFDPKGATIHRLAVLGGDVAKSRQFLSSLQRIGIVDVLVEFVVSASRLRVEIYRENLLCTILASGIISPRPSRRLPNQIEEIGDPFGDEAREYVRDLVMQREVKFEVDGMDRLGNLIGWITLPSEIKVASGSKRGKKGGPFIASKNLSVILVAHGYATVNQAPNAQRSSYHASLLKAESFAQEHNLGLWSLEEFRASLNASVVESADAENSNGLLSVDDLQKALPQAETVKKLTSDRFQSASLANVSTISNPTAGNNGLRFFIQWTSKKRLIDSITEELNSSNFLSLMPSMNFQPKKGLICAAQFSDDNLWYRARILRVNKHLVTVLFIDFGNEETVDTSVDGPPRLAALPMKIASHEPLATEYRLGFVQLPPDPDDRGVALEYFIQFMRAPRIRVSPVEGTPTPCGKGDNRPVPSAIVYVNSKKPAGPSSSTEPIPAFVDVGEKLLSDGFVCMENARMPPDICVRYSETQTLAMRAHKNIWRYGDFREDDA